MAIRSRVHGLHGRSFLTGSRNWMGWVRHRWTDRLVVWGCAAGMSLSSSGCGKDAPLELYEVSGRVVVPGKELSSGSVSLRPMASVGEHPTGTIESDGTFRVYTRRQPGAPAGQYRVVILASAAPKAPSGSAAPGLPTNIVPEQYMRAETTPLELELPRDSGEHEWVLVVPGAKPR